MELINNILASLFPIIIVGICFALGLAFRPQIDNLSRRIFGKDLDGE